MVFFLRPTRLTLKTKSLTLLKEANRKRIRKYLSFGPTPVCCRDVSHCMMQPVITNTWKYWKTYHPGIGFILG